MVHILFYFLLFVLVEASPIVIRILGLQTMMIIYTSVMLVSTIFLYFMMPETETYTLQEVEDKINKKNGKKSRDGAENPVLLLKNIETSEACNVELIN